MSRPHSLNLGLSKFFLNSARLTVLNWEQSAIKPSHTQPLWSLRMCRAWRQVSLFSVRISIALMQHMVQSGLSVLQKSLLSQAALHWSVSHISLINFPFYFRIWDFFSLPSLVSKNQPGTGKKTLTTLISHKFRKSHTSSTHCSFSEHALNHSITDPSAEPGRHPPLPHTRHSCALRSKLKHTLKHGEDRLWTLLKARLRRILPDTP